MIKWLMPLFLLVFSMSSFTINDWLDAIRRAGYLRFEILLADLSYPIFFDCLPQDLSAWQFLVCHLILHNRTEVLNWIEMWAVPGTFQHRYLVGFFPWRTQWRVQWCWLIAKSSLFWGYFSSPLVAGLCWLVGILSKLLTEHSWNCLVTLYCCTF